MALALEGIRILDLSLQPTPGALCTRILGDLGAEVIRVEAPVSKATPLNLMDAVWARNKKSIALNLKNQAARGAFYKLVEKADVLLESFRPGVTTRLGADYQTISKINPRLVYCSISGYGQDGPYKSLAGHDLNYQAIGGSLKRTGEPSARPIWPTHLFADLNAMLNATIGILTALLVQGRTGKGQYIDIALLDGAVSPYYEYSGPSLDGGNPGYNMYETKDGRYITLGIIEPWFWDRLCRAFGREDFIPHQMDKGEKREEIFRFLEAMFKTKTRDEWFEEFGKLDIEVAPVLDDEELETNPQIRHREMIVEREHPLLGKVRHVGIPIKLSETPGAIRSPAPTLGQDTEEILTWLGYSQAEIQEFRKIGGIT